MHGERERGRSGPGTVRAAWSRMYDPRAWATTWEELRLPAAPSAGLLEILLRATPGSSASSADDDSPEHDSSPALWSLLANQLACVLLVSVVPVAIAAAVLSRGEDPMRLARHATMCASLLVAFMLGSSLGGGLAFGVLSVLPGALGAITGLAIWQLAWPATGWLPACTTLGAALGASLGARRRQPSSERGAAPFLPVTLVVVALLFAVAASRTRVEWQDQSKLLGTVLGALLAATVPVVSWARTTSGFPSCAPLRSLGWHRKLGLYFVSVGSALGFLAGVVENSHEPLFGLAVGVGAGMLGASLLEAIWLVTARGRHGSPIVTVSLAAFFGILSALAGWRVFVHHDDVPRAILAGALMAVVGYAAVAGRSRGLPPREMSSGPEVPSEPPLSE